MHGGLFGAGAAAGRTRVAGHLVGLGVAGDALIGLDQAADRAPVVEAVERGYGVGVDRHLVQRVRGPTALEPLGSCRLASRFHPAGMADVLQRPDRVHRHVHVVGAQVGLLAGEPVVQ